MQSILVVDDSATMRKLVERYLESAGYRVTCATDGQQAHQLALTHDFDAIVTDLDMPQMNGLELIGALRHSRRHRHTPVVVMTGDHGARPEAMKRGATHWLHKPFKRDQMISAVTTAIAQSASSA